MDTVKQANLALRFLLELAALVAFGYWGFTTDNGLVVSHSIMPYWLDVAHPHRNPFTYGGEDLVPIHLAEVIAPCSLDFVFPSL